MRTLSPGFAAHITQEVTSLCTCWRIVLSDGSEKGFTNLDVPVTFNGLTYDAASGFTASAMTSSDNLAVDDMEVEGFMGGLNSAALEEEDLQKGLYDNALLEIYIVNWMNVAERHLERFGTIGEVVRSGNKFKTEIRGYSHILNQPVGRLFQRTCPFILGDGKCGVNLASFTHTGTVATVSSRSILTASGINGLGTNYFQKGKLVWTSGANLGEERDVRHSVDSGGDTQLQLLFPMVSTIAPGDTFTIIAGCNKELNQCSNKFSNVENYGGYPHMPGSDFVLSYPNTGEGNDGGALV